MLQLPRAEEEPELAAGFVGVSGMDMDDPTGVGVDSVRDTAVPDQGEHELVEQRGLADADGESHTRIIRGRAFCTPRRPSSPLCQLVQYTSQGVEPI
jgi:hypothetical protein